jgi:RNA polymerase sigma-70 factor (ECF subfamily)
MCSVVEQFNQIYDQYIEKIYRYVYLKVNSQEVAEDITSKVFTKGWEALNGQGKKIENPSAFLYKIAQNSVVDYYRQRGKKSVVSTDSVAELADIGKTIEDRAVFAADVEMVKTAMQKLKKDYQDVLIWHYLDDMPVEQIAKIIDKKEGTIRVMLHRGLKDLKDICNKSQNLTS